MTKPEVYQDAVQELQQAWSDFNQAAAGYIDAAIHRLKAAEAKHDALLRELREEVRTK